MALYPDSVFNVNLSPSVSATFLKHVSLIHRLNGTFLALSQSDEYITTATRIPVLSSPLDILLSTASAKSSNIFNVC